MFGRSDLSSVGCYSLTISYFILAVGFPRHSAVYWPRLQLGVRGTKVVSCACVLVSRGLNVGRSSESAVSWQLSVTGGCRWCTSFKFFILQLWSVFVAFCTSLSIRETNKLIQTLAWGASNRIGCVFELMKHSAVQDCPYWLVKTSVH